jgi:tetratricopeptide (TPR) repeat protein
VVDAIFAAAAVNLAVYAGWVQSTQLRASAAVALLLVTTVGLIAHIGPFPALRAHAPATLPQGVKLALFCGREKELAKLLDLHEQQRANRPTGDGDAGSGPVILGIHGRPGVGKTALALQLANRIAQRYPDGQMHLNMGTGGDPKPPRDILHALLRQLQWPEEEMRDQGAAELARVFRAKTSGRRILIFLDAVRSQEQLTEVLPGGTHCTVITTSRANLLAGLGQHSQRLGPLSANDAAELFLTKLGTRRVAEPDLVAEAIELCDYQPNALLSAGERARNEGLGQMLERLRREEDRLDMLRYGARDVAERIASEYKDLDPLEKRALLLLTVLESETFVPWALQPLLEIGSDQAGNILARICRVGLLELEGPDPSEFGRYRFCSLTRLFAMRQLQTETEISRTELEVARGRFRRAYLAGSLKVLAWLGATDLPDVPPDVPDHWYPQVDEWEARIADNIDSWVRAEFGNLIRTVHEAAANDQLVTCWQIALRLGDCFAPRAFHTDARAAFDVAIKAARDYSKSITGEIRVRLAKSGYLAAIGDYSDAIKELEDTINLAKEAPDRAAESEAYRRLGNAYQEIGDYDRALAALRQGDIVTGRGGGESRLLHLLLAENEAMREPGQWTSQPSLDGLPPDKRSNSQLVEKVMLGRVARRRRSQSTCSEILAEARQYTEANFAHVCYLKQEEITTLIHCSATRQANYSRERCSVPIVLQAALAVCWTNRLRLAYPQAQARCALARALVQSGQAQESLHQLAIAKQILEQLPPEEAQRLVIQMHTIRGYALVCLNKPDDALSELEPAERWLSSREPWAHAETLMYLGTAYKELHLFVPALAAHSRAVEIFRNHNDKAMAEYALGKFCAALKATGVKPSSIRRIRSAIAQEPGARSNPR